MLSVEEVEVRMGEVLKEKIVTIKYRNVNVVVFPNVCDRIIILSNYNLILVILIICMQQKL